MVNSAARIGMMIFLATEAMFFAGLISAYWILRAQLPIWPPPGQPRLPVLITGISTLILLGSAGYLQRAWRSLRTNQQGMLVRDIGNTAALGGIFLAIQGYEWVRLLQYGLTARLNVYAGTFYYLIGAHALHVVVALLVLIVVWQRARHGRYVTNHTGVAVCRMYWFFVVGVWPLLYALVYLL